MSSPFVPPDPGLGAAPGGSNPFVAPPGAGGNPFASGSYPSTSPFSSAPAPPLLPDTDIATSDRPRSKRLLVISLVVAVVVLALAGLGAWAIFDHDASPTQSPATASPPSPAPLPAPATVSPLPAPPTGESIMELLKGVSIVDELPQLPGYDRSCSPGAGCVFGPAWTDVERTGCDTRNRVLAQQLRQVVFKPGTRECKVLSGLLDDPYTGNELQFAPGQSADIQIDHVFPLARAWDAGAANWPLERRVEFANDTANLLAVTGKENGSKSDSGPGTWMPPNSAFDCEYATIYVKSAAKWGLMITSDDELAATNACAG